MNNERTARLAKELAAFSQQKLQTEMHELGTAPIENLVSEAGYDCARAYLNNGPSWNQTLATVIEDLVISIYTFDGEVFDTAAELESAARK